MRCRAQGKAVAEGARRPQHKEPHHHVSQIPDTAARRVHRHARARPRGRARDPQRTARTASVETGVTYLKSLESTTGEFATGGLSSEWTFSAFAAAGVAAADLQPPDGPNTTNTNFNARAVYRTYLSPANWAGAGAPVTDFERATINAYSAGIDPARVSVTQNLIANIATSWQPSTPGYWGTPGNFNGTVFALLALGGATTPAGAQRVPQELLDKSVATVRANQHTDGGWDYQKAEGDMTQFTATSDIDMTGAAIASLCVSGVSTSDSAVVAGKNFLKGKLMHCQRRVRLRLRHQHELQRLGRPRAQRLRHPEPGHGLHDRRRQDAARLPAHSAAPGRRVPLPRPGRRPTPLPRSTRCGHWPAAGSRSTPPVPNTPGAPRFVGSTSFTAGTTSRLALVINDNSGTLKVCSVPIAATAATTTLRTVLTAATTAATPACVTGFSPASGTITSINGVSNTSTTTWRSRIDNGTAATAANANVVTLGDTIGLKYGS